MGGSFFVYNPSFYNLIFHFHAYLSYPHPAGFVNRRGILGGKAAIPPTKGDRTMKEQARDRKSTRLNSSHVSISYAVFCLKKKKKRNDMSAIIVDERVYKHITH